MAVLGRTSFTYDYELVNAATGERIASARSVQVCFDYQTGKAVPIPEGLRQELEANRI